MRIVSPFSNNMLYPKENRMDKQLLYSVSMGKRDRESNSGTHTSARARVCAHALSRVHQQCRNCVYEEKAKHGKVYVNLVDKAASQNK